MPSLPPKKIIINDSQFLEERTRGLQRWLTLVCRHPVMCHDSIITFFLTDEGSDLQHRIRNAFRKLPDEFMTSDIAATAKVLLLQSIKKHAAKSWIFRNCFPQTMVKLP